MTAIERMLAEDIPADERDTYVIRVPLGDLREIVREIKQLRRDQK